MDQESLKDEPEEALDDWSEAAAERDRRRADLIYVAKGPIIMAVLIANLITALVVSVIFEILRR